MDISQPPCGHPPVPPLLLTRLLPAHPHPHPSPLQQVGASEATLLSKLGIKPFSYGLIILQVYDSGSLYDPKVRQRAHMMHVPSRPTSLRLPACSGAAAAAAAAGHNTTASAAAPGSSFLTRLRRLCCSSAPRCWTSLMRTSAT